MDISIFDDSKALGEAAGMAAAAIIQEAINHNGVANIIVATGTSQFETLSQLTMEKDIQWVRLLCFILTSTLDCATRIRQVLENI